MFLNRGSLQISPFGTIFICIITLGLVTAQSVMEPFMVEGKYAPIQRFPHTGLLSFSCEMNSNRHSMWICGSSILNQKILMTAAHCLDGCDGVRKMLIYVGSETMYKGRASTVSSFIIHSKYEPVESLFDVGLVKVKTALKFSQNVKRIVLMKNPPYSKTAQVAGWGLTNEVKLTSGDRLMFITQNVMETEDCAKVIGTISPGTFCARSAGEIETVAMGDSGGALVINGYIQIGIVSHKMPQRSSQIIVYTDVSYFYDWIKKNTKRLYC